MLYKIYKFQSLQIFLIVLLFVEIQFVNVTVILSFNAIYFNKKKLLNVIFNNT